MTALQEQPATVGSAEVVVARQPIVDRGGAVVGFELLYRRALGTTGELNGEQMTAQVVLSTLTIGVEQLVGDALMFCNADRGVLVGETPVSLPPTRTVIEVLENVSADDAVVEGCRDLVERGYHLALDDFVWSDDSPALLELASIVKIDLRAGSREHVEDLVARCRPYGVRLLAEKIETDEELAWTRDLGFELFQGYVVQRPEVVRGTTIPPSTLARVQLAAVLLGESLELEEIEDILRHEPGLVLQVLQLASIGSHHGMRREIKTIREALVLLGTNRIRQWIALTALGAATDAVSDGIAVALVRARTCELLARRLQLPSDLAFTAGLLSTLDLLLGADPDEIAPTLDLSADLTAAAFEGVGPTGELVRRVRDYQEHLLHGEETSDRDLDQLSAMAFAWAMPYVQSLQPAQG